MKNSDLIQIVNKLQQVTLDCFDADSCNWNKESIFGTHFDWHSSVHAHWMLLSSARILNDSLLVSKFLSRFNDLQMKNERQLLMENPDFELPYGQAWLLLLLSELEKHDFHYAEIKSETLSRVIAWLINTEFPQKSNNNYHSWLIGYFLLRKSGFTYPDEIDTKFKAVNFVNDENDPKDFFSSESLFSILKGLSKPKFDFDLTNFPQAISIQNCHMVGKLITQSWATPEVNLNAFQNSLKFTEDYLNEPRLWNNDFDNLGHWIPQFLWFGLWLSMGAG